MRFEKEGKIKECERKRHKKKDYNFFTSLLSSEYINVYACVFFNNEYIAFDS